MEQKQPIILAADDHPANLNLLFDLLSEAGFDLLVAQNGESALTRAEKTQPDIILLDVLMPGLDGFETCRRLKSNPLTRAIPVGVHLLFYVRQQNGGILDFVEDHRWGI